MELNDPTSNSDILSKTQNIPIDKSKINETHSPIDEMNSSIFGICEQLIIWEFKSDQNCETWLSNLCEYQRKYPRLLYSSLSNKVFQLSEKDFGLLETNLDKIKEYAIARDLFADAEKSRAFLKFYDHINLAHRQQVMFSTNKEDLKRQFDEFASPVISNITKEMTGQLVGLIGLFTALSFIVFGGISSMSGIMEALESTAKIQSSILPVLIVAIAWAFCMMNLLFAFMYFVIRVTQLPKPVDDNAKNVVQRYPVIFLTNYILLVLFLIFGALWFAECNGIGQGLFNLALQQGDLIFIGGSLLILGVIAGLGSFIWDQFIK